MNTVVLVGAEQVSNAGHNIRAAAAEMQSAASLIQSALDQHQRFMQQWLEDFGAIVEKLKP